MRLVRPVRSSKCSHLQCFEAKWWIVGNEKHPQWLCPLCNRALRFDELIVDGFSLDILDVVPDKYDEVVIEADNAWHTEDGAYGSSSWLALNAKSAQATRAPTPKEEQEDSKPDHFRLSTSPDPKGKRKAIEILSSDDEEEEPLAKSNSVLQVPTQSRPYSAAPSTSCQPSAQPPAPGPSKPANNAVIDLTLSDSDDDDVEDAVSNFDRLQSTLNPVAPPGQTLAPPTTQSRAGPSSARSPNDHYRNLSGEGSSSNGYSNGNGNANHGESSYSNGHGRPYAPPASASASTSTATVAARQHTDRYVPAYMNDRADTAAAPFTFNPNRRANNKQHLNPDSNPYRPPPPTGPAADTARPLDPVDSWRAGYDERARKRERERERREMDMETDSEDDDYRYSRRH
jgi:E3 SUMO-protein ligase PIAS1